MRHWLAYGGLILAAASLRAEPDVILPATTYASGQSVAVFASNSIANGGAVVAAGGSYVRFFAGARVTLGDGFRAHSGSVFRAGVGSDTVDSDGDGMGDQFEDAYGLDKHNPADALGDADGDGLTNVAEFNLGYSPLFADAGTASEGGSLPGDWPVPDPSKSEAVGVTAGELAVGRDGGAGYSIPLWVTPGTAGMEPKLTLNYSSQAGAGIAGFGWSLGGVAAITRGGQSLAVDGLITGVAFSTADRFFADGQRLVNVAGAYGAPGSEYRTELEGFTRFVAQGAAGTGPAWFRAWTKAGLIVDYGATADSARDAGTRAEVLAWHVNRITDTVGNYMDFVYAEDAAAGAHELTRIDYTGHATAGVAPYASVRFEYEARSDPATGYVHGVKLAAPNRLRHIRIHLGETVVRTYTLGYASSGPSARSLLASIVETGADGAALPPTSFAYAPGSEGFAPQPGGTHTPPVALARNGKQRGTGFIDLDGDGYADFVQHMVAYEAGQHVSRIALNRPWGWEHQFPDTPGHAWPIPHPLSFDDGWDHGGRFVDLDGDGLPDFIFGYLRNGNYVRAAYLNTGSGWAGPVPAWEPPSWIRRRDDENDAFKTRHFLDVNGDGRVDFLFNNGPGETGAWLNNGAGWTHAPAYVPGIVSSKHSHAIFLDLNGDGLPDQVKNQTEGHAGVEVYLNTGSGWNQLAPGSAAFNAYKPPLPLNRYHDSTTKPNTLDVFGVEVIDVNGDGLADLVYRDGHFSTHPRTWLNTGAGWLEAPAFISPIVLAHLGGATGSAVLDLNGDGLPDILRHEKNGSFPTRLLAHGTGGGFAWASPDLTPPYPLDALEGADSKATGTDFVDLDADGFVDQVFHDSNSSGVTLASGVHLNLATRRDVLTSVTNGFGVTASITYAPLTLRDAAGNPLLYQKGGPAPADMTNLIAPAHVVKEVRHDDGTGGHYTVQYRYGGLRSHRLRGGAGFEWMTTLDTRTDIVSTTIFAQEFPFTGTPVATFTRTAGGAGVTLSESETVLDQKLFTGASGAVTRMVFAKSTASTTRDLDGSIVSQTSSLTQRGPLGQTDDYDDFGNALYLHNDLGDGYTKTTVNTYDNTATATTWHLGRLTRSTVTSTGPVGPPITRVSAFTYHPAHGLLTGETIEPDSETSGDPARRLIWVRTTHAHDAFGNRVATTVTAAGYHPDSGAFGADVSRTTTASFGPDGRLLHWTRNALGHEETILEHHAAFGLPRRVRGPNLLETSTTVDGFGRPLTETRADGTTTSLARRWAGGNAPPGALHYLEQTSTGAAPAVEFFDAFGRSLRKLAVDGDGFAVATDTAYDALGRAFRTSVPFRTVHQPVAFAEVLVYDVLDRPLVTLQPDDEVAAPSSVTITLPDGSTAAYPVPAGAVASTFRYNGRVTRLTNARGVVHRTTVNGQGWITEVVQNETGLVFEDAGSVQTATLARTYDAVGNLVATDAAGAVLQNTYDVRGRRTATADPDMGSWSYLHDGFGELVAQTDAKGQKTLNWHDPLGRPSLRLVLTAGGALEERTDWFHDTAPGAGKGRLHRVETSNAAGALLTRESHTYDALGRPTSTTRRIDGADHATGLTYDAAGRVDTTTYPTGFAVRHDYNAFGFLKVVRRADAGRNDVYWMALRDPSGGASLAIARHLLGNGVVTERTASRATGRLRDIDSGIRGGWGLQRLAYDYDTLANVRSRADAATGLTETAFHDALNRLTGFVTVQGAAVTDLDTDHAANGNILFKSGVGAYAYAGARPHAVTAAGARTYAYDANGGMTSGDGRSVQWTGFGQIRRIERGGSFSEFAFGAGRERVRQVSERGVTLYVGGLYERFSPTVGAVEHRHWIHTPSGRVAVHKSFSVGAAKTEYFHHDALGSITVVTGERGGVLARFRFDPWGGRLDGSGQPVLWGTNAGQTRGFTDHEHLDDLGLVHMNGRIYDPLLGRFLSADPYVDGADDSQGYNRYSYVHNNPLNATDPSGYLSLGEVVKIVAVVVAAVVTAGAALAVYAGVSFGTALGMIAGTIGTGLTFGQAVVAGAAAGFGSGFAGSLLNGGSIGDAFKAGLVGAAIGGVSGGIIHGIGTLAKNGSWNWFEKAFAHGASQGLVAEAAGGEFRHGFYAAAFTSALGGTITRHAPGGPVGKVVAAAVVGGTAAAVGGGKFANGAVSGAFTYLLNDAQSSHKPRSKQEANSESYVILLEKKTSQAQMVDMNTGEKVDITVEEFLRDEIAAANKLNWGQGKRAVIRGVEIFATRAEYDKLRTMYEGAAMVVSVGHGFDQRDSSGQLHRTGIHLPLESRDAFIPGIVLVSEGGIAVHCSAGDIKRVSTVIPTIQQEIHPRSGE